MARIKAAAGLRAQASRRLEVWRAAQPPVTGPTKRNSATRRSVSSPEKRSSSDAAQSPGWRHGSTPHRAFSRSSTRSSMRMMRPPTEAAQNRCPATRRGVGGDTILGRGWPVPFVIGGGRGHGYSKPYTGGCDLQVCSIKKKPHRSGARSCEAFHGWNALQSIRQP